VAALTLWGCGGEAPAVDVGSNEVPPVNVAVAPLVTSDLTEWIELSTTIEPWKEVSISTEMGGTVEAVGFERGDRVREGQELARIGTDLFQAQLDEAEALLRGAEAHFEKTEKLFAREAVPRQELLDATSRVDASRARVTLARLRLERSILRAPIDGVAVGRELDVGEFLPPGAPVTVLHQAYRLKATAGLPETEVGFFRKGGAAIVQVAGVGDVQGQLHLIGPAATGLSRTFPIEVKVDNASGQLRPGMLGRVRLLKRRVEDAVVVERDALVERDEGLVAFVLDGDVARLREVVLGPADGNRVVVREGLAPGDQLIVTGARNLTDGHPVKVVEGASS
jgi:membrane fusion protein (multidrug efflux system)